MYHPVKQALAWLAELPSFGWSGCRVPEGARRVFILLALRFPIVVLDVTSFPLLARLVPDVRIGFGLRCGLRVGFLDRVQMELFFPPKPSLLMNLEIVS